MSVLTHKEREERERAWHGHAGREIGEAIWERRGEVNNHSDLLRWASCFTYWADCVDVLGADAALDALYTGHRDAVEAAEADDET